MQHGRGGYSRLRYRALFASMGRPWERLLHL